MTDKAIKLRIFNVWDRDSRGTYLVVSTTSKINAEHFSDANTFMTENDVWIELPND